ncbi:hypothetical protein J2X97_000730 [Epilithonimonas hungarica]|nr:hypothetical protein [Epilithonimonas hungarica]
MDIDIIKYYILRDTTYNDDNTIFNKWVYAYKLLSQAVKKGDRVVLHTKKL